MELREIIKKLIISYPIIYGCTMMAAFVCCLVFHPDAVFGIDYLGKALVFALAGDLPSLVFCLFFIILSFGKNLINFLCIFEIS